MNIKELIDRASKSLANNYEINSLAHDLQQQVKINIDRCFICDPKVIKQE